MGKFQQTAPHGRWVPQGAQTSPKDVAVKYPEFAEGIGDAHAEPGHYGGLSEWVDAPASSHLHSFRYNDARNNPLLQPPGGDGRSQIEIRFRPKGRWPMTWYRYFFADHDEAQAIWEFLQEMEHPGMLVKDELEGRGVPYMKIS